MIKKILLTLLFLALSLSMLAYAMLGNDAPEDLYRTEPASKGSIMRSINATGRLSPEETVNVGAQVSGTITSLLVDVNDEVKKGQLLAEIDPSLLEAELNQSRTSMDNAKFNMEQAGRDLARTKALVAKDYLAKVELERAEQQYRTATANYQIAKSQFERASVNLSYTKIVSPVDGTIISREVTRGQTVASSFQTPNLFKVARDLTRMTIDASLTEADIAQVQAGMPVRFTVDAYPGRQFEGLLSKVNMNAITLQDLTTYIVSIDVSNAKRELLPGMTAYVTIVLNEKKDVLRVPIAAVRFRPPTDNTGGGSLKKLLSGQNRINPNNVNKKNDKTVIYVLKDGVPSPVEVETGVEDNSYLEVTSGELSEGMPVIFGMKNTAKPN